MPDLSDELHRQAALRDRAGLRIGAPHGAVASPVSASAALGVLHKLASSPATATEALSLLHELQVYQVEIALQDEELRASRVELETLLQRHLQLYDHSPAGSFTIDRSTVIAELNLTGARLLALDRDAAIGRRLDVYLAADDRRALDAALAAAAAGRPGAECELQLNVANRAAQKIRVAAARDPAGLRFVLAAFDMSAARVG